MNRRPALPLLSLFAVMFLQACNRLSDPVPVEARIQNDFMSLESALEMFRLNAARFPTTEDSLQALVERPASLGPGRRWTQFMHRLPVDPWGRPYGYSCTVDAHESRVRIFTLGSDLRDPRDDHESRMKHPRS